MAASTTLSIQEQRAQVGSLAGAPNPKAPGSQTHMTNTGRDPKEIAYIDELISSLQRNAQIGEQPVTIVNLNPYNLMVQGPEFAGIHPRACEEGQAYAAMVVREVIHAVKEGLDRNNSPVPFWPIALASEFERTYQERGGVFIIRGDLQAHPELESTHEFKTKYARAKEQMFVECARLKQRGDAAWNASDKSARRNIGLPERRAAKVLHINRKIAVLPPWMDDIVPTDEIIPVCKGCGAEPKAGVPRCASCGYILDPAKALDLNLISESDLSLERLTRKEVTDLGISAYVAETSDERDARRAKGLPKPMALTERAQQAELDKEVPKTRERKA